MTDEDDWLDIKTATSRIRQYTGFSTGAAEGLLHRAGSSGEVRCRYHHVSFRMVPFPAEDWHGTTIETETRSINKSDNRSTLFLEKVKVNAADLDWWLKNRCGTGTEPGDLEGVARTPIIEAGDTPVQPVSDEPTLRTKADGLATREKSDTTVNTCLCEERRGRPQKGRDLWEAEFERRYRDKLDGVPVPDIAAELAKWLNKEHPEVQQPKIKSIENRIWEKKRTNSAAGY
jgi:hypothetical protein